MGPFGRWLVPVATAIGITVAWALARGFAPEAAGHGTDAVIRAYHPEGGRIRPRVPLVKALASALTIGAGGSGGREGPIGPIGAGLGSVLAGVVRVSEADRRVLMMAGAAGGMGAMFHAPSGGALSTAGVLYRRLDCETEVLIPCILAAVTAYAVLGGFTGFEPLFFTETRTFRGPITLPYYFVLALVAAVAARAFIRVFRGMHAAFDPMAGPGALLETGRPVPVGGNGRQSLHRFTLPAGHDLAGRTLREVRLPLDALVVTLGRGGQVLVPHGATRLDPGDQVILVATPEAMAEVEGRAGGPGVADPPVPPGREPSRRPDPEHP